MKKLLLLLLLLLPYRGVADMVSSGNVIPQQFFQNNQEHNEWTCTDPTHNHGNNIGAMVNGDHLMHPGVSLANDVNMTQAEIQNGWTSTLGADIWHWNTSTSTTTMTQTITDSAGNVTTQTRDVVLTSCGRINCGSYSTYTDSHVQGANTATDFQIAVRFDFAESTNRTSHWAVDIKNPTLNITYEENPQPQISQETLTQLENVDTQIEDAIEMLENEEIGGTTFTEMVEDIIIDSGLDMTLTMGFVEPEMNMEEQMYVGETLSVDTLEQTIDDEMAGVMVLEAPVEMDEPTVDMPVMVDMDMPMPEPTFTEMAVETFEDMTTAFSDMFDMEMPEDLSTEAATELMDAMVEMDMPEAPLEEPTNVETLEEAPVETVAMAEPEPEMETPQAMEEEVVQSEEPVAMGEDDSMTSSEPTMEENQSTEEVQSSENETVTTETTTETPQEENTSATSQTETDTQSEEVSQEGDTSQESETVSEESSMDENTPSENTPTQEGGDEVNVADTETDGEVSDTPTVSVEVQEIGEKVAKIIAKVNQNLKKVSDRVRAAQLIRLKGIQTDGPNLKVYASKSFYPDTGMNGVPNPDFFQDINILEQQQIYADAKLAYRDNDPIAVKQSILIDINNKKNKLYRELRDLKR
jgi:hypothetical protein|tara:strand:+ start:445 stop:2358 length:1914 start_codon:yes stop_codon:yes gene_type:complete